MEWKRFSSEAPIGEWKEEARTFEESELLDLFLGKFFEIGERFVGGA